MPQHLKKSRHTPLPQKEQEWLHLDETFKIGKSIKTTDTWKTVQ